MEDDKLKELFGDFNPLLSDSTRFMERLNDRLDTVELIRRNNCLVKAANRRALVLAALAGIVVGVGMSWLVPYISLSIQNPGTTNLAPWLVDIMAESYVALRWTVVGAVVILSSLFTYRIVSHIGKKRAHKTAVPLMSR